MPKPETPRKRAGAGSSSRSIGGEELARLHFINSLFEDLTGSDLYLAAQVKAAIESSIDEASPREHDEQFLRAAIRLLEKQFHRLPNHGFGHWDCSSAPLGFSPLWARQELIAIFKKLSPWSQATVVVTNLRLCICPPEKRWTAKLHADYTEAVGFIRELAREWSTSRAKMTLLFF